MTTKQNAIDLARTARSEAANTTKRTIAAIITNWNECVKQAGFWCIYDFPTTGYTRKSQLIADLLRCADQLDEYVEPNPHAAQTVEQQTREFNAACTRVLDVEEAHAEALDIDRWIDDLTQNGVNSKRLDVFCLRVRDDDHVEALEMNKVYDEQVKPANYGYKPNFSLMGKWEIKAFLESAHAEALEKNSAMNHIIDERQQIEDCEFDERTEQARLAAMRDHYLAKPIFKDVYKQALWLWNIGYVTSLYDGMEFPEEYQHYVRLKRAAWVAR